MADNEWNNRLINVCLLGSNEGTLEALIETFDPGIGRRTELDNDKFRYLKTSPLARLELEGATLNVSCGPTWPRFPSLFVKGLLPRNFILVMTADDEVKDVLKKPLELMLVVGGCTLTFFFDLTGQSHSERIFSIKKDEIENILRDFGLSACAWITGHLNEDGKSFDAEANEGIREQFLSILEFLKSTAGRRVEQPLLFVPEEREIDAVSGAVSLDGLIDCGRISVGEKVYLKGFGVERLGVVEELQRAVMNRLTPCDSLDAGDSARVKISNVSQDDLAPGQVLSAGVRATYQAFEALVYIYHSDEGGTANGLSLGRTHEVFLYSDVISGCEVIADEEVLEAGYSGRVTVKLPSSFVISQQQGFALKQGDRTIATGIILRVLD